MRISRLFWISVQPQARKHFSKKLRTGSGEANNIERCFVRVIFKGIYQIEVLCALLVTECPSIELRILLRTCSRKLENDDEHFAINHKLKEQLTLFLRIEPVEFKSAQNKCF